ncbi:MAG: hypothetical protein KAI99_18210 [Cyclobacteriaceae bacterium]|nr:hypothetical protein [Cyclobacteriaceae bacterium]MCK5470465.1 hypothetical protein [Cyclobacteriaceae bacterium]
MEYIHQKIKLPDRAFVGVVTNKQKRVSFACWSKDLPRRQAGTTRAKEEYL